MLSHKIKCCAGILMALVSYSALAEDTIKVTVKTTANAAALGFEVAGNKSGGLGKSYTGKGPKGQQYSFGFKKGSVFGDSIPCGTLTLDQDSIITLIYQDKQCTCVLS